jgi:hypothetical protein
MPLALLKVGVLPWVFLLEDPDIDPSDSSFEELDEADESDERNEPEPVDVAVASAPDALEL